MSAAAGWASIRLPLARLLGLGSAAVGVAVLVAGLTVVAGMFWALLAGVLVAVVQFIASMSGSTTSRHCGWMSCMRMTSPGLALLRMWRSIFDAEGWRQSFVSMLQSTMVRPWSLARVPMRTR